MENGEPCAMTSGTWCLPVWSAESWASELLKRLSQALGWGKVRNGIAEGRSLSSGENMVLGTQLVAMILSSSTYSAPPLPIH
ncbi:hypothetical protein LEMLEM_LOCUS6320 [Lemmus lemmus]